ncbi:MAG: OmpA family protein [Acidisphaera sp.]|nr:OmpA family protein [Acidisphaera sp.]
MRRSAVLLMLLAVFACAPPPVGTGQKFPVFFTNLSSALDDNAVAAVSAAATWARRYPNQPVSVIGYADPRAGGQTTQELSQRRAQAVKQQLVSDGVASDRIAISAGDASILPLAAMGSRRVDISIGNS